VWLIGAAFEVANVRGAGFLELAFRGVGAKAQVSFPVCYKGQYVGEYGADLVVYFPAQNEACATNFRGQQLSGQYKSEPVIAGERIAMLDLAVKHRGR
jgi:PD-(D/E)XK nuclease superfamily